MRQILRPFFALALILAVLTPALADTIRLKDGSVIRGQVIGFKDQQFTILIGSGAQGRRSRTLIYVEDIESIEFDAATTSAASTLANEPLAGDTSVPDTQPVRSNPPRTTTTPPVSTSAPTFFTIKIGVHAKQCTTQNSTELCSPNGWTNTGLVVRRGQRLRITSTGRVSLGGGRFSTSAGLPSLVDNDKLMRTEPTGALIAVIGDDNDDFLLISTRRDFVAQRDGVLFLGVNEGNLNDNTGTYDVVIEAEAGGGTR